MGGSARRRLYLVLALLVAGGALGWLAFGNIGENLVYFWEPTQLHQAGDKAIGATIRLGGVVKPGTLQWRPEEQDLRFVVTDGQEEVTVHARGAPPQMMREGIGVVVEGTMTRSGIFESDQLMVKHSNEYRVPKEGVPPEQLYQTLVVDP